jgi:hypothetical protein
MWGITFFLTLGIIVQCFAKKLVAAVDRETSRRLCGRTHGYFVHGLHVRDFSTPVSRLTPRQFFTGFLFRPTFFLALGIKILQETSPLQFRNIFYSEFVFCGVWLIPMLWIPESPGIKALNSCMTATNLS